MSSRDIASIRAWEPGDGLNCDSRAYRTSDVPCGPPVVTARYYKEWGQYRMEREIAPTARVYCATHIPTALDPGTLRTKARKAASEELAVNHWDEFNELVKKYTAKKIADQLDFLPAEVRAGVIKNMDADSKEPRP